TSEPSTAPRAAVPGTAPGTAAPVIGSEEDFRTNRARTGPGDGDGVDCSGALRSPRSGVGHRAGQVRGVQPLRTVRGVPRGPGREHGRTGLRDPAPAHRHRV